MKRKEHSTITDLGWWQRLSKRSEKELEWWYQFEKNGRGHGADLKEIRRRQRRKQN
ncbi:MAG: hypothetical protein ACE5EE_01125 [Fidelibacterota bacterium]